MSLTVDGFWKAGFWSTTFWADGFWFEGAPTPPPAPQAGPMDYPMSWVQPQKGSKRKKKELEIMLLLLG